jgi:hypothetical protein
MLDGDGYFGGLCPGDRIALCPGEPEDIESIAQPRTTVMVAQVISKPLIAGGPKPDFLAIQCQREPFPLWKAFEKQLDPTKMVHVADGGARPNAGAAGWGALIGQNGKCTFATEISGRGEF